MIKAVLFDYGGTLVQARRPWEEVKPTAVAAPYALLCRHGLKAPYGEYTTLDSSIFDRYSVLEKQRESDIPDIVKYCEMVDTLFPSSSKAWRERVAAEANNAFWDVATANYVLQRGARRCLAELRSMKLRLAVVSNHHSPEALTNHLTQLDVKSHFSSIIVSSQVGFRKPDRRIFAMGLSSLRVHPSEAVFVGDSIPYDIEGAKRAGMTTILIGKDDRFDKQEQPDFTVVSLTEVPKIVSSL
ncbi:MAG: HAD family hydrolase [Nitrososphaerales archaeon]|jgi:putative hydrolase of the HAD superfamily